MTVMKKVFYILLFAWFGISCTRSGSEVGGEFSATEYYIPGYLEADMLKEPDVCTDGLDRLYGRLNRVGIQRGTIFAVSW